jgi:hypothetical protein
MLPGLDDWVGRAGASPSAIDRGERETVKGQEIPKETYVDLLDVNRVPPDLRQGTGRKSSSERGVGQHLDIAL